MDCLFGLVGDGFTVLVADKSAVQSIVLQKTDEDKIMVLDDHKLMANSGETGDRNQFCEFAQKNLNLYKYRNGIPLSTHAAAHFIRGELAAALRKGPYQVNLLIGGYDADVGPSLYFMDYLATMHKLNTAAFGYGAYFLLSLMDKHYKKNMKLDDALKLVDMCIAEVRSRLVVAPPNFIIKIVDKDGARFLASRDTVGPNAFQRPNSAAA
eukprot:jgi/Chlat1/8506/Chrsp80S07806